MEQANKDIQVAKVTANRPASSRNAIVFCCDQGYLPFSCHAAAQISALDQTGNFDICICTSGTDLRLPESISHLNIRVCKIDVGTAFSGLRIDKGSTLDSYLRIALPEAFSQDYDRILYLDGDIFVQSDRLSDLFRADLGDRVLGAVTDNTQWRTPNRMLKRNTLRNVTPYRYFNSGVLLIDVASFNEAAILRRCIEMSRTPETGMVCHDQNLLNAVLEGQWAELSPMWNWQFSWAARFFATVRSPHIIHFIGTVKPWKDPLGELEPRFADAMRRFTQNHFPDFPFDRVPRGTLAPDSPRMTKMLIKHLLSRRKIARYLARFPDDMTVQR